MLRQGGFKAAAPTSLTRIGPLLITLVGIVACSTTTLALGSRQLAQQGAIVTRLTAIEEMAGMTLLCSDKTGTLTLNTMVIQVSVHGRTSPARFCHLTCLHTLLSHAPQPPAELQRVRRCRLPAFPAQVT